MAEIIQCPNCGNYINLELDVMRDENGVYCVLCDGDVGEKQRED